MHALEDLLEWSLIKSSRKSRGIIRRCLYSSVEEPTRHQQVAATVEAYTAPYLMWPQQSTDQGKPLSAMASLPLNSYKPLPLGPGTCLWLRNVWCVWIGAKVKPYQLRIIFFRVILI